jgi:putative colanic acid biosynthesis UDP-glucose lipid carrier transferase
MEQSWTPPASVAAQPAALARSVVDPLVALVTYLVLAVALRASLGGDDLLIVALTCGLTYPGKIPFGHFNSQAAFRIVLYWSLINLLLAGMWLSKNRVGLPGMPRLDISLVSLWALVTPAVLIGVHAFSPRVTPYLSNICKTRKAVIVGVTELALRVGNLIETGEAGGQRMLGYFDDRKACRMPNRRPPEVLGGLDGVGDYAKRNGVDIIYICLPMTTQPRILDLLEQLRDTTASIYFVPDIFISDLIHARVDVIGDVPVVSICESPLRGLHAVVKRIVDLAVVLAGLPVAVPLMLVIAALVRTTSPGPALFRQKRYGLDGREILVWKFRTMKTLEDGRNLYHQVTREDERVTPLGRILRKTSLDELPQLINVIAGNMSLVGPRPHALAVNEQCRRMIPGYMVRHKVKPGITGWAQIHGHRGGDDLEEMQRRTEFDLEYLRTWSVTLDLLIIWKTALMLLRGDPHAY